MSKPSKRKGRKPVPSKDPTPTTPRGITDPESEFSKYLQEHPEGVRVTYIGTNQAGVPISMISPSGEVAGNLRFAEVIKSVAKGKRRQSSPETISRNVEICDLRKQDKKKWTHGKLAHQYGMKKQSIAEILKNEEKWRTLNSNLPR